MYKVVLVEDHVIMRNGLAGLINRFPDFQVLFEADNGLDFIRQLNESSEMPDIVLLDVTMPEMDGYATAKWIKQNYPNMKILVLSMLDDEYAIIRMIKNGAKGYILKNIKPKELLVSLTEMIQKGFYFNDHISNKIADSVNKLESDELETKNVELLLTPKEREFLILCCSEHSYKDIAEILGVSSRTVDGYRDSLFIKLNVTTRVGLVVFSIKAGIISI